jgi:hypothetical protein
MELNVISWLGENILPAILLGIAGLFYRKFDGLAASVQNISNKMSLFEERMENTNKHIESIVVKMDKVESHDTRLALIERTQEDCQTKHIEFEKRVRDLEYAKAANINR